VESAVLLKLKTKVTGIPDEPGCYLMKNSKGAIIYVGKAVGLKSRVGQYFGASSRHDYKTSKLVEHIADFDIIITKTGVEALLLERTLIKHHKPQFNILLRDDKEYPYLRVAMNDQWPRIEKVRRRKDDGAVYLGPFGSAGQLKKLLDAAYRIFPLIRCSRHEFANTKRPCNYFHMKMCLAPCTKPVEPAQYKAMISDALDFIRGNNKELVRGLRERMQAAAETENFELAAIYRDQLTAFESVTERQSVVVHEIDSADFIGFAKNELKVSLYLLQVRDGYLVSSDSFVLASPVQTEQEALTEFMIQYYDGRSLPREIALPFLPDDADHLKVALLESHPDHGGLTLRVPSRGSWGDLLDMAQKNAFHHLQDADQAEQKRRTELEVIREKLRLGKTPRRIECIDISNIQGTAIVASNVCFIDGRPARDQYRHYTIKTVVGAPDDFSSIHEVVDRRLRRAEEENDLPDLLVIDGGRGQLNAAAEAMAKHPAAQCELVSLAKSRVEKKRGRAEFLNTGDVRRTYERIFFPDRETPVSLAPGTPEFRLFTQIRDEAHRFAISHHRKRRAKISASSDLDAIPGIGPKLRAKIMETFGGLEGLRRASLDELRGVKGLRESAAIALHSFLHSDADQPEPPAEPS
jgi:excinuclease ABC subunit C